MSSLKSEIDTSAKHITIIAEGLFGFSLTQDLRRCYVDKKDYRFTLDFEKVTYIDSAGLGMLLNMLNYLEQDDGMVHIIKTLPEVRQILSMYRFDLKFTIE